MDGLRGKDFASLKKRLIERGRLYYDYEFPATSRSIYPSSPGDTGITWSRPTEIAKDPKFIVDGATSFDMSQGQLGNCWFIAAAASLASKSSKLLARVCPFDQNFKDTEYAGIFRFHFWHYGKWQEVIIDDRLPTVSRWGARGQEKALVFGQNNERPNEFWPALLEKAYAKLNGSYEAIDGGNIQTALVDMTGGISEVYDLNNTFALPDMKTFFTTIKRTMHMMSLMGVSIPVSVSAESDRETKRPNGLYEGHAYSILGCLEVTIDGNVTNLVKLRNPWGRGEWIGPWSDSSVEWRQLSEAHKKQIGLANRDDGEFWIPFDTMVREFSQLGMCHLVPDALTGEAAEDTKRVPWEEVGFDSSWVRGVSAGGCGNPPYREQYWINPQYHVQLDTPDGDADDGLCTLITSLMEKERKVVQGTDALAIGLDVFELKPNAPSDMLTGRNLDLRAMTVLKRTEMYSHHRSITQRLRVKPGKYVLVPSTFDHGKEADFILRVYTQKKVTAAVVVDNATGPIEEDEPPTPKALVSKLFGKYAGHDQVMDAKELSQTLNDYFAEDISGRGFSVEAARNIIPLNDLDFTGTISLVELEKLIKEMDAWKVTVFYKHDRNQSGNIDIGELSSCLKTIGFSLSNRAMSAVVRRYGGKNRKLNFQDFITCFCRIMVMYSLFRKHAPGGKTTAEFTLEEWMYTTLYY